MYCINGSCSEIEEEASNEFKDALVALGAIDQVGKEFDPDTLGLFKGTRETCHKPVFGMVNCCAGKVSGLFSGGVAAAAAWAGLKIGSAHVWTPVTNAHRVCSLLLVKKTYINNTL